MTRSFLPAAAPFGFVDIVGRVVLAPSSYLDLIYRFRLDQSTLYGNRTRVS